MTQQPNRPGNPEDPYVKKYGQYVKNRTAWLKWTGQKLGNTTIKDMAVSAATPVGINPTLLYTSAMEEGMPLRFVPKKDKKTGEVYYTDSSDAYGQAVEKGVFKENDYLVDGFRAYGLDTFSSVFPQLVKKGYLKEDFKGSFTPYDAINEKKETVHTAAFRNDQAALQAKAAMMAYNRDLFLNYAKKKGVQLTPEAQDFFTLASYNGGLGNGQAMLDYFNQAGLLKDNAFLQRRPQKYSTIYDNVMHRIQGAQMLKGEGIMKKGGELPQAELGVPMPVFQDDLSLVPQLPDPAAGTKPKTGYEAALANGVIAPWAEYRTGEFSQQPEYGPAATAPKQPFLNKLNQTALAAQQAMMNNFTNPASALNITRTIGGAFDYVNSRKQEKEMEKWQRTQMMADNLYPVHGSTRGTFFAEGGLVPEVPQGLLTNEGPIGGTIDTELLPAFSASFNTMPEGAAAIPQESHTASLRDLIMQRESGGNYKALPRKKDGTLASSAAGAYQFLWNTHKDAIAKITGVKTKEEFLNNPDAQDQYFSYWDQTTLTPWASRIKQELGVDLPDEIIKAQVHFSGPKGAYRYFEKGIETKDAFGTTSSSYMKRGSNFVKKASSFAQQFGFDVTSTTGGKHNKGSKHYAGRAVDIRTRNKSDEEIQSFIQAAQQNGFVVRDERERPEGQSVWGGPHLHVEPAFQEGGEYELTQEQIAQILRDGGQVEFLS